MQRSRWDTIETSGVITRAEKPVEDASSDLLPMKSCDETMILNRSVSGLSQQDDASTPSLRMVDDEEEDEYDILSDYMGSLTCHETDEMLVGFELYVQHHHDITISDSCNPAGTADPSALIVTDDSRSTGYVPSVTASTPKFEWSTRAWLEGDSTESSVNGVDYKNGFEPDIYTLEGIRKDLFAAYE